MKEQLIHILDQSVCLTRKQMKEYLGGAMLPEEMHAVEIHLNSCPLCNMAMEGFEEHSDAALEAIASLNSGFLKEHFANISPQIHLNSLAPTAALATNVSTVHRRGSMQPFWQTASIAAAVLLAFGVLWYFEFGKNPQNKASGSSQIAMATRQPAPAASTTQASPTGTTASHDGSLTLPKPASARSSVNRQSPQVGSKDQLTHAQLIAPEPGLAKGSPKTASGDTVEPPSGSTDAGSVAMESGKQRDHEIGITASRAFTVSRAMAPESNLPARTIEKSAARPLQSIASFSAQAPPASQDLSISGGRTSSEKYMVDGVRIKPGKDFPENKDEPSALAKGDASFDKGKYGIALGHYREGMNTGAPRDRDRAAIRAAQCYAALGNKAKAEELLVKVMDQAAGPERRAARRILRSLRQN